MSETVLVNQIVAALGSRPGVLVERQNTGAFYDRDGRLVRIGTPGRADIRVCAHGLFIEIEAKSPTGRQTPAQKAWQGYVERAGGIYVLARSVEEAVTAVDRALAGRGLPAKGAPGTGIGKVSL